MIDILWVLLCSGLVFLMQAGFMCLESGLTRSKNSINVAVKNLADFGVSAGLFWVFGYGIMFGQSGASWFGNAGFFPTFNGQPEQEVFFLFQMMFCGTATTIVSGAAAERLKFHAYLLLTLFISGIIYPVFGQWSWHSLALDNSAGWLESLGFVDFAGSSVVHSVGAWFGLAVILVVGARQGRYAENGASQRIQGANLTFSVLGAMILWFGWIGFNGGSTLALNDQVPGIIVNTVMAGVAGMITMVALSGLKNKIVEVELLINGTLAGLVAVTACCHVINAPLAVVVGGTGAAIATLASQLLDRWHIDDAVDAFPVHGAAGMWGTLCVGLFGQLDVIGTGLSRGNQIMVQLFGIGVAAVWTFGLAWTVLTLVNKVFPLRISPEDENIGLNVSEHQAKTETYELFQVMDYQARTNDLSLRVPVEPFTEIGHIATRYNHVIGAFEKRHDQSAEDLAHIYYVTEAIVAAVENQSFKANNLGIDEVAERTDELGSLARAIQQVVGIVEEREQEILSLQQRLEKLPKESDPA
ncbi:ammonium transporter [Leptothoe sp. PORK10 BA2]|uniref:ammonium transporter n=1 Tax=Leptothoe sp. PORK10 BA2 TaxID=3110254 RepID=UPI002B217877|nr:ammonium transporter [Leptothoe sp. PORK10 BA2]MEA5462524.1 ammonium transporter [Leptothoe sp. PORK10 BA2]